MKTLRITAMTLIVASLVISATAAQETENNGRYIVTPAGDTDRPGGILLLSTTYYTITQGETDWYSKYVSFGTDELDVDLNWGSVQNSLAITIVAPDATLGPYYDSADGIVNGRIALSVSSPSGLTPGTWKFYITGYSVTGSQTYTFLTY